MLVPPFQCVWLGREGTDGEEKESSHCGVEFEVCGSNDATVIFKRCPGSKRLDTRDSYCVIFGSNRNRCVRIERHGECQVSVEGGWTKLSSVEFRKFWVYHKGGTFRLGEGSVSSEPLLSWTDPDPLAGALHMGLSSWDCHNTYRSVKKFASPLFKQQTGVSSLLELCSAALMKDNTMERACAMMQLLCEHDLPGLEPLLDKLVLDLANDFDNLAQHHMDCFVRIPCSAVAAILKCPALVSFLC